MKPYYEADGITIYHCDCREVLPTVLATDAWIVGKRPDVIITDPQYGVHLGEVDTGQERDFNRESYASTPDTLEYLQEVIIPSFNFALSYVARAVITPGNRNAFLYPRPADIGVWYNPAGTGRGPWGFILAHLIFYYGADPHAGRRAIASSAWALNDSVRTLRTNGHPCPKPLRFTKWLVAKASKEGELVLDLFMGSGTTLRTAKDLGRRAIGIEIEEKYCEIAAKRLAQKVLQFP